MATFNCVLGKSAGYTNEWFDGVNNHTYCCGFARDHEPLPECLGCPHHVYKEKWKALVTPGRMEIYNLLLDRKCPAWLYDNFNALQTTDYLMSRGVTIQKTGNWSLRCNVQKGYMDEVDEEFYLECSECHRQVWDINQSDAVAGNWAKLIEPFPYCHCGAKMTEEVKTDAE